MKLADYLHMGLTSGLSKKDTLLSTPGEVADLWELYLKAHGVKRKTGDE